MSSEFPARLTAGIAESKMTLARLSEQLKARGSPASIATLSYWRSGSRKPEGPASLAVLDNLETILDLAPGHLSGVALKTARLSAVKKFSLPPLSTQRERALHQMMDDVQAGPINNIRELTLDITFHVDGDGRTERLRHKSLIQPLLEPASKVVVFYMSERTGIPVEPPSLDVNLGGSAGESWKHPDGFLACTVVHLREPVAVGETALLEYTSRVPEAQADDPESSVLISRRMRSVLIAIEFDDAAPQEWCEVSKSGGTEADTWSDVKISGSSSHMFCHDFGPGVIKFRWGCV